MSSFAKNSIGSLEQSRPIASCAHQWNSILTPEVGDLLTLTNTASYGIFIVIGRKVMGRMDPLVATTIVFFGARSA